ncbi:MAG: peptidyl-prolyl cis-trans isomerase [Proteobacteria bacterium]|nr:peptidyl-prolyl cis-trans isomerase [Pseudomonadota bacterium]
MASISSETSPERGDGAMRIFRRVAREPLVHFLLIGAVLFVGLESFQAMRRPVVRIDAQDLEQLANYWQIQMQRPPNKDELKHIIDDRIDEELMAREALRLGLDKGDMIIRRRLAQKMAFATDDTAQADEPTDAQLKAYYSKTADRYAAASRVSFQQAFFSGDRPNGGAQKAAAQAMERAEEDGRADPAGDPFIFPLAYQDVSVQDLLRDYGAAFVKTVSTAPLGAWAGPVVTPYGFHLVKVTARSAPTQASFESVRPQVRDAYLADRRAEANAAFLKSLHKRYRVIVAGVPDS